MPHQLSPESYAARSAHVCPACSCTDITIEMDFVQSTWHTIVQAATCRVCLATWAAIYEITGYDSLRIPIQEHGVIE